MGVLNFLCNTDSREKKNARKEFFSKTGLWKFPCNSHSSFQNIREYSCQKQGHGNFHEILNQVYEIITNILG